VYSITNKDGLQLLTKNEEVGYDFEMKVQDTLLDNGIDFMGNPRDKGKWKASIDKGADVYISCIDTELELKYVGSPVWIGSIDHNYIPRFGGAQYKIIVTNDLTKFSTKEKEYLKRSGIKIVNLEYLMPLLHWIDRKVHRVIVSLVKLCRRYGDYSILREVKKLIQDRGEKFKGLGMVEYPIKKGLPASQIKEINKE